MIQSMATATAPSADLARAVELFHALSDETRLEIVQRLRNGERCVCDLTDLLAAAQSRLSFHLKVLKDAGLVIDRKEGRWVHYSLNRAAFAEIQELLGDMKPSSRRLAVKDDGCC
jgi:ArsR family transcriptional regulator, arsenate/arsenite/antimonite-responsive transcriptional repressor